MRELAGLFIVPEDSVVAVRMLGSIVIAAADPSFVHKYASDSITCQRVRRNLDFYAEISEATVKNDNKQQKKNSYGKGKVSKNKVNPE